MDSKFKKGDYVVHSKHGVGHILNVDEDKQMYSVSFCSSGLRKVRFSTFMSPRKNGEYEVIYINKNDRISIELRDYIKYTNERIFEPFTVKRFKELFDPKNVICFQGQKFLLDKYKVRSREGYSHIVSERSCIMHVVEPVVNAYFRYIDEKSYYDYKKREDECREMRCLKEFTEDEWDQFVYNVSEKYGELIEINKAED